MNKTAKLDMSFSVYVYTCIPEANTFLDDQIDELSLFPDNDEFTHFFGEDASKIDGLYQEAHKELSKMLKATFDNLNEDFGIEAKFSDIAF